MNIHIVIFFIVMTLEWLLAVLPWIGGVCGVLFVAWVILTIMEKHYAK